MSERIRNLGHQANLVRRAFGGDPAAVQQLVARALRMHRQKFDNIRSEIEYHHEHTWDAEAARAAALEGEPIPPQQVLGAFGQLHSQVLMLTAGVTIALMADEDEIDAWEEPVRNAAYQLLLLLHTPEIRYTLVAGFREDVREDVERYLDRMGAEIWGTIEGLLGEGEIHVEDFPPETQAVMQRHIEHSAAYHGLDEDDEA